MAEQRVSGVLTDPSPIALELDSMSTDVSSESEDHEIRQIFSFESPQKK